MSSPTESPADALVEDQRRLGSHQLGRHLLPSRANRKLSSEQLASLAGSMLGLGMGLTGAFLAPALPIAWYFRRWRRSRRP